MITKKAVSFTLIIVVIYVVLTILFMNGELVKQTLIGNFPIDYKFNLIAALIMGASTSMTGSGLFLLFITAILTGVNVTLLFKKISQLKSGGKLHLVVGGSSFIGIIGSGCAACGLPILSFFGLAGSIGFLPFHGTELSLIAIIMLSISLFLLFRNKEMSVCLPAKI